MKIVYIKYILILFFLFSFSTLFAKNKKSFKNEVSFFWGWNHAQYSTSNLHLKGADYDFTLKKIVAKDRQSPFGYNPYFKLNTITIPQYDYRLGWFFKNNWQVSVGFDHMKYVMKQNQTVAIDGFINTSDSIYNGTYTGQDIVLKDDFLTFEHTDGLNYLNAEIRRMDNLYNLKKLKNSKWLNIDINGLAGFGVGFMYPRTNTHLLNYNRYDEFHIAGFGLASVTGLNISFYNFFFLQCELKGGFINMPNIRTTEFKTDKGSQHFWFAQENVSFGFKYRFRRR